MEPCSHSQPSHLVLGHLPFLMFTSSHLSSIQLLSYTEECMGIRHLLCVSCFQSVLQPSVNFWPF